MLRVLERLSFVIEGKRSSVREAVKQCLLAVKSMRDNNGVGEVFGFVTTGEKLANAELGWRIFMTRKMHVALFYRGMVTKDVIVFEERRFFFMVFCYNTYGKVKKTYWENGDHCLNYAPCMTTKINNNHAFIWICRWCNQTTSTM